MGDHSKPSTPQTGDSTADGNLGLVVAPSATTHASPGGDADSRRDAIRESVAASLRAVLRKIVQGDSDAFFDALAAKKLDEAQLYFPAKVAASDVPRLVEAVDGVIGTPEYSQHHLRFAVLAADALFRLNEFENSVRFAKFVLKLPKQERDDTVSLGMHCILGSSQSRIGMHALALEHFSTAIVTYPDAGAEALAWAHHNSGSAYIDMGDNLAASNCYRVAAELRARANLPLEPAKTLCRAADAAHRHNSRVALGIFQEVLASIPECDYAEQRELRGRVSLAIGSIYTQDLDDCDSAIPFLVVAADLLVASTSPLFLISALKMQAFALRDLGRPNEAKALDERINEAIRRSPTGFHAEAEKLLGEDASNAALDPELDDEKGQQLAAIRFFKEAERHHRENEPLEAAEAIERAVRVLCLGTAEGFALRSNLLSYAGEVLREAGLLDAAIRYSSRACAEYPASVASAVWLGKLLLRSGRLEAAAAIGERVVSEHPHEPAALLLAGHCAYRAGDPRRARLLLERARELTGPRTDIEKVLSEIRNKELAGLLPPVAIAGVTSLPPLLPTNESQFLEYLRRFARHAGENSDSFWKSRPKRIWSTRPEAIGRGLLVQALKEHSPLVSCFREVEVGGGRIDLTVNILGRNFVVELKMCGPGYSLSYAEGGVEQLSDYLDQVGVSVGYLLIFDGRAGTDNDVPPEIDLGNGKTVFTIVANVLGLRQRRRTKR